MKNTLLKFSSLLLIAASLVFTSCNEDEAAPTPPTVKPFTVADGKVGVRLKINDTLNNDWFADSLIKAKYTVSSRILDLEAVKYNTGTKVLNSHLFLAITLDRTTPNKTYTANFTPNTQSGDIIFYGSAAEERDYAINPGNFSSVGEFTVSNFDPVAKRATVSFKNLVFTRNGKAYTISEGKFNNVKLQ